MTRPGGKIADRERLDRLLQFAKLKPSETSVFKDWFEKLGSDEMTSLDERQRLWVERVYYDQNVGDRRAEARKRTRAANQTAQETHGLDAMPRPKRPPGK